MLGSSHIIVDGKLILTVNYNINSGYGQDKYTNVVYIVTLTIQ